MGSDIVRQITANQTPLRVAGFAALTLCLIPGLPKIPFLLTGGVLLLASSRVPREAEAATDQPARGSEIVVDTPELLAAEIQVDPLGLELSPDLIDLVDTQVGGDLLERVKALRRKLAVDLGIVAPPVRTRDNLELPPRTYAIMLFGIEVARGEAPPGTVLAIGDFLGSLPGDPTQEPVFGLEAKWIPAELRSQAELSGATVVDRASVITTHLAEVITAHAARLLGREDVRMLTDVVKRTHPVVVDELTPAQLSLGEVQRVLQSLLAEGVSIRDLVRIFEALSLRAKISVEHDGLVEAARAALGPAIAAQYTAGGRLAVITLDPMLEQGLLESLRPSETGAFMAIDGMKAEAMVTEAGRLVEAAEQQGITPVLACSPQLRLPLMRLLRAGSRRVQVLSYSEISGSTAQIETMGVVNGAYAGAA
jgi:flagellar biosynthesis protein FlhA